MRVNRPIGPARWQRRDKVRCPGRAIGVVRVPSKRALSIREPHINTTVDEGAGVGTDERTANLKEQRIGRVEEDGITLGLAFVVQDEKRAVWPQRAAKRHAALVAPERRVGGR